MRQYSKNVANSYSNRPNGLECIVKDYLLDSPPPLGSIITVKHHGVYSNGILKNPVYWRQLEPPNTRESISNEYCHC